MRVTLIAAVAENGVIGRDGDLPWRLPADLKHFKALTLGKPIVMGRKTWQSLGRPLPGRRNIVVTRDAGFVAQGAEVFAGLDAALEATGDSDEVMVIGGGEIYAQAMARAGRLEITHVHAEVEGDTQFPQIDPAIWRETAREDHAAEGEAPGFSFVSYVRR